jgi:hypothetical protein
MAATAAASVQSAGNPPQFCGTGIASNRPMHRVIVGMLVLGVCLAGPKPASAQEPAPALGAPVAAAVPNVKDVGDLWRFVRHKQLSADDPAATRSEDRPFFFISPSVSSKPSTGLSAGLSSSLVFTDGDSGSTRISSAAWALKASQKGQFGTGLHFRVFTPGDRWFVQGDNRLSWSSQDTYALGIVEDAPRQNLKYQGFRFYDTVFREVARRTFIGFGLNVDNHNDVRMGSGTLPSFAGSAYVGYTTTHGFALDNATSSGTNIAMFVDTRDNPINASRGWLASGIYRTFFDGFLGGNTSWQQLDVDVRTYKSFGRARRQKVAFWVLADLVTAGVPPYLDLPAIGDDPYGRSARGYTTGRYRGPHDVYGEVEYRVTLTSNGLLGAVAFANATTIDGDTDEKLFHSFAPASGGGLRVLLSKRSKTNLCVDYGRGFQGSHGVYLAIQETF